MTSTIEPRIDEPGSDEPGGFRWSVGSVAALAVVAAMIGFWVWAFSPLAPDQKADGLRDTTFVAPANAHCKAANDRINALPRAMDAPTPSARADVVAQANLILADMVADVRHDAAGSTGRDRELLDQWFADWNTYIDRRDSYAEELRTNEDGAVFTVPARNGGQFTETMDGFSRTNELFECLVPLDV